MQRGRGNAHTHALPRCAHTLPVARIVDAVHDLARELRSQLPPRLQAEHIHARCTGLPTLAAGDLEERQRDLPAARPHAPHPAAPPDPASRALMDHAAARAHQLGTVRFNAAEPALLSLPDQRFEEHSHDLITLPERPLGKTVDRKPLQLYLHIQVDNGVHRQEHGTPPFLAMGCGASCFCSFALCQLYRTLPPLAGEGPGERAAAACAGPVETAPLSRPLHGCPLPRPGLEVPQARSFAPRGMSYGLVRCAWGSG